ncbi:MAG: SDR family NAD(P)-dependent oxidoreductase [Coxiellaceae bacterium]|nr:SDR family NAD(P)-dependent oxidoreductase [Coxiellaceae bacterium]
MKKWALITGAGTGIGRAAAEALMAQGVNVLAAGRRLEPLQSLQTQYPDQVKIVSADIASNEGRDKIIAVVSDLDQLNYLIHNAALVEPAGDLLQADPVAFSEMMQINVEAPLYLTQRCVDYMPSGSRILHIGSGAAHNSAPGIRPYSVSKAAFYNIFLGLREELQPRNIGVLSIRPGVVDTPMQTSMRALHAKHEGLRWAVDIENQLVPASSVGRFITWLLCELPQARVNEKDEWDIYDDALHKEWVKDIDCPCNPKS